MGSFDALLETKMETKIEAKIKLLIAPLKDEIEQLKAELKTLKESK